MLTSIIEIALNQVIYRESCFKLASCQYLSGRSIAIIISEFNHPIIFVFRKLHVNVFYGSVKEVDCTLKTSLINLVKIFNIQQLMILISKNKIEVKGDRLLIQEFLILLDRTYDIPTECISLLVGDVTAEAFIQILLANFFKLSRYIKTKKLDIAQIMSEEWYLLPSLIEFSFFSKEIKELSSIFDILNTRLAKLENK